MGAAGSTRSSRCVVNRWRRVGRPGKLAPTVAPRAPAQAPAARHTVAASSCSPEASSTPRTGPPRWPPSPASRRRTSTPVRTVTPALRIAACREAPRRLMSMVPASGNSQARAPSRRKAGHSSSSAASSRSRASPAAVTSSAHQGRGLPVRPSTTIRPRRSTSGRSVRSAGGVLSSSAVRRVRARVAGASIAVRRIAAFWAEDRRKGCSSRSSTVIERPLVRESAQASPRPATPPPTMSRGADSGVFMGGSCPPRF